MDILLINAPFTIPESPNISIPTLAAYLKEKGFQVSALDLNQEFFYHTLTPKNILNGLHYATEKFCALNRSVRMNFSEMVEYYKLFRLITASKKFAVQLSAFRSGLIGFQDFQKMMSGVIDFYIHLASTPWYPEGVIRAPVFIYNSPFNEFSGQDILDATERELIFSEMMRATLKNCLTPPLPKVVGISAVFASQIVPAFYCASIIKKIVPDVHITMGGPGIFVFFRELKNTGIFTLTDSLVMDEGEVPLESLLHELSGPNPDLGRVPNLVYLSEGKICRNERAPLPDMVTLPSPDYSVFDLDRYMDSREKMRVPLRLSRGCAWQQCSFCKTTLSMVKSFQQPPEELAYQHIKHTIAEFGIRKFMFSDESAHPIVLEYISRRLLSDGLSTNWIAHTRVSRLLTQERCKLFKDAGCTKLSLGVESFSNRVLKLMRKGITCELTDEVIRGIEGAAPLNLYMILGFPSETEEEFQKGYDQVRHYKDAGLIADFQYSLFTFCYGSHIWEHPLEYGIVNIKYPEGCDLSPDIYEFESSGMPRERVFELYLKLNPRMNVSLKHAPEYLEINGTQEKIQFNLYDIQAIIDKKLTMDMSNSFISILQRGDQSGLHINSMNQ